MKTLTPRATVRRVTASLCAAAVVAGGAVLGSAAAHAALPVISVGTGFSSPAGVAVDTRGNVYVADQGANKVIQIDTVGIQREIGSGYSLPLGVAVDSHGTTFVADYGNGRIEQINSSGAQSDFSSTSSYFTAVAVDSADVVYAADASTGSIVKFDSSGAATVLATGFTNPSGLTLNSAGDVYVSDAATGVISVISSGDSTPSPYATGLSDPQGLAFDGVGNLIVAERDVNRVSQIAPDDAHTRTVISSAMHSPIGIALDASGDVYVGDSVGHRLAKVFMHPPAAPAMTVSALSTFQNAATFTVSWTSVDQPSVASVDVRYRRSLAGGALGGYTMWKSSDVGGLAVFTGVTDARYCFSARAYTSLGIVGTWSAETCTAVPLDERALIRNAASAWARTTDNGWISRSGSKATLKGSSLTTATSRTVRQLGIVALTCPTCGSVDAFIGKTKVGTFKLAKSGAATRSLLTLPRFTSAKTGKIQLVVSTSGKTVKIDALAISGS